MPADAVGALVHSIPAHPRGTVLVRWLAPGQQRPHFGQILLRWRPNPPVGMDVTALLGLATGEVLLATWPGLTGDWSSIIRPTLYEATGLCSALATARAALDLANHLADCR